MGVEFKGCLDSQLLLACFFEQFVGLKPVGGFLKLKGCFILLEVCRFILYRLGGKASSTYSNDNDQF